MAAIPLAFAGKNALNKAEQPGGKKNAPAPADYMGLAREQGAQQRALLEQQTQANRPNQNTPYASSQWMRGPDGQWIQNTAFAGPMKGLNESLQKQAADAMSKPFSLDGLTPITSGDAAREQAINAAYGQAASRLDPRFSRMRNAERTRLLNQGLTEGSAAYNRAMQELGSQENDAYNQAQYSAIGQGAQAGQALFNQSMAQRQQGLAEALRQRGQAFGELQAQSGMLNMPGFNSAGLGQADPLLQGGGLADAGAFRNWQANNQAQADFINALMQLGGTIGTIAASDEGVKENVHRLPHEAIPGVPYATFEYSDGTGYGEPGTSYLGVVAQDLQAVAPEYVTEVEGVLHVAPLFAPIPLPDEE